MSSQNISTDMNGSRLCSMPTITLTLLTKYVGFDGEREVCVISQDVNSFGDGDVLKVLTVDLHDLKQDRQNDKHFSRTHSKLTEVQ